jgi:hypothetical protein
MARRCLVRILTVLLFIAAGLSVQSCKEEQEPTSKDQGAVQETVASEAQTPDTTSTTKNPHDFEEQEGVQQESPPQYDY